MKKLLLLLSVSLALAQNYSLSFDGVDDYVEIINDAPDANSTYECWFKANDISYNQTIMYMKGSYNAWLYVNDGNLLFHQDLWDEDISIDIASDTWYHVALTFENNAPNTLVKLWLNGVNVASKSHSFSANWNHKFWIAYPNNNGTYFNGLVSSVKVSAEITYTDNFQPIKNLSFSETTHLLWNLNEGTGAIAYDATSNDNDGTINGATWSTDIPLTYVPDDNFEQALIDLGYDDTLDDYVLTENISSVTSLAVGDKDISNLTGIEDFTSLTSLDCRFNDLTSLDLTGLTGLTYLDFATNQLTSIDLSNNTSLEYLYAQNNQLTSMDLGSMSSLIHIYYNYNQLPSLDLSANTGLVRIECTDNGITSIDVSGLTALEELTCFQNELTSLDVSTNTALTLLDCKSNQLTSLDVSTNSNLTQLICTNNSLTVLDISGLSSLSTLRCDGNQLTSIDATNNASLQILDASANNIVSASIHPDVPEVRLQNNSISQIDLSNNTGLRNLSLEGNSLTSLDVSSNVLLTELRCNNNQFHLEYCGAG